VYHNGDRYFASLVQGKRLCRQRFEKKTDADALIGMSGERLDSTVADILQVARNEGAESYYEVAM
jgi:thiamine pyrophosphokinase